MEKDIWEETNFYGVVDEVVDKYSNNEKKKIKDNFIAKFGDSLSATIFRDKDFFTNFINNIPSEEQAKYMENTINYGSGNTQKKEYDPNYVIVARRAVPSHESKTENFWSTDPNEPLNGLKDEVKNEQRLHSVIMISTLGKLDEHGIIATKRGGSDGEIAIDPNKNFNDFLFMYKPQREFYDLVEYLKNGGIKREDLLKKLSISARERAIQQGLPIKENQENFISLDDIEESTSNQKISDINSEIHYLKQMEKDKTSTKKDYEKDDEWE